MAARDEMGDNKILLSAALPTPVERRIAIATASGIILIFAILAPFANIPLPQHYAFIPPLEAAISVAYLITSILLFAQFSTERSRALLVIASGYLFAAIIMIIHAFFSPSWPRNLQVSAWLSVFWQTGFIVALSIYVLIRDEKRVENITDGSVFTVIAYSVAIIVSLAFGITWAATAGSEFLPRLYLDSIHPFPLLHYIAASLILICACALASFCIRQCSVLDQWLMVVGLALIARLAFAGVLSPARFSLGYYAGHLFSLVISIILLVALLAEMTRLYGQIVRSNAMLERERNNKLMNLEAMSSAISHEVRQPLAAITMNGEVALDLLERSPTNFKEISSVLKDIVNDSHRTSEIFKNIRILFGNYNHEKQAINVNKIVLGVLRVLRGELKHHSIVTRIVLTDELPLVMGQETQLQEVIINLVQNAIDAMANTEEGKRALRIRTQRHGHDGIAISVEDSGPGIDLDKADSIFEAFITTKSNGMGLGLAITRMIVERHGGTISASSGAEGGAVFQFVLPSTIAP